MKTNIRGLTCIVTGLLTLSGLSHAVEIQKQNDVLIFDSLESNKYNLTILAPNKELYNFTTNGKSVEITAIDLGSKSFQKGQYKFEFTPLVETGSIANNVRKMNDPKIKNEFIQSFTTKAEKFSGVFAIEENQLADSSIEENATKVLFNENVIIDGSACVGFDCVNGESFGFDTIKLKENNLRIKFEDTSTAASFPSNDWQLTANDSANGGANKFSIDDVTGGRTPFTVEAGAPSHSLYVDDGGRIGNGTSTPSVEIHTVDGDTPTLRLQQDGSSGFAPQTWDVAGNETNFFIRDVTNGSQLPFRIRPDAPTSSLEIAADGNVGLGTSSAEKNLHVKGSGTVTALLDSTSGAVQFRLRTDTENRRILARNAADVTQTQLVFNNDNVKIAGATDSTNLFATFNGTGLTVNGSISTTASGLVHPDYVFKSDYKLMPLSEVKEFVNTNYHLPEIPSEKEIEESGYNMTEMQVLLLKKVEELTLYSIAQQELIENLQHQINLESKVK